MTRNIFFIAMLVIAVSFASAQITGTKHDLSQAPYNTPEICEPCHTPHNGDTTITEAPLWNHTTTAVTNYTLYVGVDMQNAVAQPTSGITTLCLSCHDGTVAVDAYGGAAGTTTITGTALLGTDISDDHPVALQITDGLDADIQTIANINASALQLYGAGSDTVECASCHNVHDNTNAPFLRMDNALSAMCLVCHLK